MLDIRIVTIFPRIFDSFLSYGNPARGIQAGFLKVETVDLREFTSDRHRTTDDYPFGGGTGMVMKPEPVVKAIRSIRTEMNQARMVLLTPQGRVFRHSVAEELAQLHELVFICGRYEGLDERIRRFVDDEISVGDYVLSGGEIGAMVIMDAVIRLIPGVLGSDSYIAGESFYEGLLEYPQYTRPRDFEGLSVPEILLEGHHEKIRVWRRKQSLLRTYLKRPDLLERPLTGEEEKLLAEVLSEGNTADLERKNEYN